MRRPMVGLWPFRRRMLIARTLARAVVEKVLIVMIPSIDKKPVGFEPSDLLLVALCSGFLDFPIAWVEFFSPNPLSLDGTFRIKRSWLAICAKVVDNFKFLFCGHITVLHIVAFGMLPSVTQVAIHRVPIILSKAADALNNVVFDLITRRMCRILWRGRD